ncbi:MAG TPA: L,D-transpeptidase [Xanthobacteraceae bacterium]|nr:L,D-transpeptidase [Xanthobacteraceae bacterium]
MAKRKHLARAVGAALVVTIAAAGSAAAQSQVIAASYARENASILRVPDYSASDESGAATDLPARLQRQVVDYRSVEAPGTIIIDTPHTYLYFLLGGDKAIRYGIGVGREGFTWSGVKTIERKTEWPDWIPPADMLARQPYLPRFMAGGPGNPLGARAMYLAGTVYRIHGTNAPDTIGKQVSSGCIRMLNQDVIDLYERAHVGTKVVVLPMNHFEAASISRPLEPNVPHAITTSRSVLR